MRYERARVIPEVWKKHFLEARQRREEQKLARKLRSLRHMGGARVQVGSHDLINFASNDYLGLASDLRIAEAAASAAGRFGWGTGSSRLVTGTTNLHLKLEAETAAFRGRETALVFGSGYQANLGVLSALAGEGDTVFSDELNHASIVAGCRLSGAAVKVFKHRDYGELERKLNSATGRKLVVTDTLFSIEGDTAELPRLAKLCERFGALLVVDDAHANGCVGKRGRGIPEEMNCVGQAAVLVGTYSKALGSYGGFVCCDESIRDHLVNTSRPFIYTTSLPIALVAANIEALKILRTEGDSLRLKLAHNVKLLRSRLEQAEFVTTGKHHIIGVRFGSAERATFAQEQLEAAGLLVYAMRWPTVAKGQECLRISITAAMDEEMLARLVTGLKLARDRMVGKDTATAVRREAKRPSHQSLQTSEPMPEGRGFDDDDTDFFAGGPMSAADSSRNAPTPPATPEPLPEAEAVQGDFEQAGPSPSTTLIPGMPAPSAEPAATVEAASSDAPETQASPAGGSVTISQQMPAVAGPTVAAPQPDAPTVEVPAVTAPAESASPEPTTIDDESDDDTDESDLESLTAPNAAGETLAPEPTELADPEIVDIEGRTRSRKKRKTRTRMFKPGDRR